MNNSNFTLSELIEAHTRYLVARNLRPSTIYQRGRVLTRLQRDVGPADLLGLDGPTIDAALMARRIQAGSRALELAHLADFYRWAVLTDLVAEDPTSLIPRPLLPRRIPRPMGDADLERALRLAPDLRILTILMLAAYAGLRACEIAQARAEHVLALHRADPTLVIQEGKGGSPSTVPLHPVLVELLEQLPARGPLVSRRDGQAGNNKPWTICAITNPWLHSIGITDTLHSLRHWFGTNLYLTSGCDIRATQEGMRHRSIVSTEGYVFVARAQVSAAVVALPTPVPLDLERRAAA